MFARIVDLINGRPYLSLASVILGCATLVRLGRWRSRSRLPPGPKGYPIIGNLLDLPPTHIWEKFGEWGKQYGGLSFLHPRPHIIHTLTRVYIHGVLCAHRRRHIHQHSGQGDDITQFLQSRRRPPR